MIDLVWWQWTLLVVGALLNGLAKTGVPGLGIVAVVLFALALGDVRLSAGTLLPLLCLADVLALWWWRRHAEVRRLAELAPWVALGVIAAVAVLGLPQRPLTIIVGTVITAMAVLQLWRRWRGDFTAHSTGATVGFGFLAGLATTIANAAGPVMNLYLLGRHLAKAEFIATGAWFFFIINLAKLPVYAVQPALGHPPMLTTATLLTSAVLAPAVIIGALAGQRLARVIPQRVFDATVLALALVGGLAIAGGALDWLTARS
jgi:uncharacterized membrane protein YfcA